MKCAAPLLFHHPKLRAHLGSHHIWRRYEHRSCCRSSQSDLQSVNEWDQHLRAAVTCRFRTPKPTASTLVPKLARLLTTGAQATAPPQPTPLPVSEREYACVSCLSSPTLYHPPPHRLWLQKKATRGTSLLAPPGDPVVGVGQGRMFGLGMYTATRLCKRAEGQATNWPSIYHMEVPEMCGSYMA